MCLCGVQCDTHDARRCHKDKIWDQLGSSVGFAFLTQEIFFYRSRQFSGAAMIAGICSRPEGIIREKNCRGGEQTVTLPLNIGTKPTTGGKGGAVRSNTPCHSIFQMICGQFLK